MNRTERAKKRKLRKWQNDVRDIRNSYIRDLSYTEDGCGINAETFRNHQQEIASMIKHVRKKLKEEKIAVNNSRKEKIGA